VPHKKEKKFSIFTKGSMDHTILIVTLLLLCLGIIMVLSASAPSSLSESGNSYKYVIKQSIAAAGGLVAMFVLSSIDYRIYRKLKWIIYVGLIGLLVLVGAYGMSAGGATRWINIAGFNFQPSELAKTGFILVFASYLSDMKESNKMKNIWYGCMKPLLMLVPIIFSILVLQNHFSATFIICAITLVQMFVAGTRISHLLLVGAVGGIGLLGGMKAKDLITGDAQETTTSFRSTRIQTWLDPFSDPTGDGWQIIQSLYAIGSGGLFGLGLGNSKQKYLYLPEPHNDFIFAVLAEELGFFGCVVVILLFVIFIWRGIVIAMKAPDTFGTLIAIGIVTMIGLQALINIAVVSGAMPVTGMPLPFFSYGGTAIVVNLATVGILLNISKSCSK
jgi:cell division protein FtsW